MPRKKPFSTKLKKQQIQQKRERRRGKPKIGADHATEKTSRVECSSEESDEVVTVDRLNHQPAADSAHTHYDPNRYRLHFERESKDEIEARKLLAKKEILKAVPEECREVGVDTVYQPGSVLDIPKRPPWNYGMSKAEVEGQEEAMFEQYIREIYSKHKVEDLSYFEHNLETWRQLWRVLEISDVVVLITDIRHPALHFSPALYRHVLELGKSLVLVLNKIDLVPPSVAVAWRHYFLGQFPELKVVCFTSFPGKVSLGKVRLRRRRAGALLSAVGPRELLAVVSELVLGKAELVGDKPEVALTTMSSNPLEKDKAGAGVLTLGMVGHPNVGKSSIINGLLGRKVVSTSRTPGHTKHFQTIFLTRTLRLCDCPGLVFPSLVPRQLQVLSGVYPVAQVREPYTAVGYLAARVPLVQLLSLRHPDTIAHVAKKTKGKQTGDFELNETVQPSHPTQGASSTIRQVEQWTAWDVCDAWAEQRGYYTARGGRLDTYRAANSLLRLAVDGRICLYYLPPNYTKNKETWVGHSEVADLVALADVGMMSEDRVQSSESSSSEDEPLTHNKFAGLTLASD